MQHNHEKELRNMTSGRWFEPETKLEVVFQG